MSGWADDVETIVRRFMQDTADPMVHGWRREEAER